METGKWLGGWLGVLLLLLPLMCFGMSRAELRQLRSEMQQVVQAPYDSARRNALLDQLDGLRTEAAEDAQWAEVVQLVLLEADVYQDAFSDDTRALAFLEQMRVLYGEQSCPDIRKLFLKQAELYVRQNNAADITRLIYAFKTNPNYDGGGIQYSGGGRSGEPLTVVRPQAKGSDSITVTALEQLKKKAANTGRQAPHIRVTEQSGASYALDQIPGMVLLVDFWHAGWVPWRQHLDYQLDLYAQYHSEGLDVLGVCIGSGSPALGASEEQFPWPEVQGNGLKLAAMFGLYGEAGNILIGRNGVILGRNIYGADLANAVRSALREGVQGR